MTDNELQQGFLLRNAVIKELINVVLPPELYSVRPTVEQVIECANTLGPEKGIAWIRNWASDSDVVAAKRRAEERKA